jgi:hypothetical protein
LVTITKPAVDRASVGQYDEGKRQIIAQAEHFAAAVRPRFAFPIIGPRWIDDANAPALLFEFNGKRLRYPLTTEMVEDYPSCEETQRILNTELPTWLEHSALSVS